MIARRCPKCNTKWYSADTRAWKCGKCGAELGCKKIRREMKWEK